jgi:hypothetical protein
VRFKFEERVGLKPDEAANEGPRSIGVLGGTIKGPPLNGTSCRVGRTGK